MRLNFFIGCNDKDTHAIKLSKNYCFEIIVNTFDRYFDSYTIQECYGIYKSELEQSYQVSILCDDYNFDMIRQLCDILKDKLNQECIGFEVIRNHYNFI